MEHDTMEHHFNIYITIVSTFGIILIGYFFGRCNVITASQGKGISLYMVNLALPVLIFKAMVTVNFKSINWLLWTGILLAKAFVFVVVVVLTILFQKEEKLGKAGLYGIFVTQSNDFAFGLPIVQSIFSSAKSRYLIDYIYLVAPISLAFLNPIGFSMMEYEKARKNITRESSVPSLSTSHTFEHINILKKTILTTLKGIGTNPLVFMIVFGVAFNFIFQQNIPPFLSLFVNNISASFGATALFYLGWSLGSKVTKPKGLNFLLPIVLVLTKGIFLPLVMRLTVSWMVDETHSRNTTHNTTRTFDEQAKFGFIYGSIPTAPTVIIFASIYGLTEDVIASGLVIGTVLFAPILFASVQMMRVLNMKDLTDFCRFANVVTRDVSILNLICCIWVMCVFAILRLYRRTPHRYTLGLVCFQFTIGLHGVLYAVYNNVMNVIAKRVLYWLLMVSMYGFCTWSVVMAISVGFLATDVYRKMARYLIAFGVVIPFLLATIMISVYPNISKSCSPYFMLPCEEKEFGLREIYIVLNALVFLSIVVSLIRINKSAMFEDLFPKKSNSSEKRTEKTPVLTNSLESMMRGIGSHSGTYAGMKDEDCNIVKNYNSANSSNYEENVNYSLLNNIREEERSQLVMCGYVSKFHCGNHLILVLLTGFVALVNTSAGLWYYVSKTKNNGLFLGLQMLGLILTFGQGFFTFITFGFLKELFLLPFFERCYNCLPVVKKRSRTIHLPNVEDLDPDVVVACNRFVQNHYGKCVNDIVKPVFISGADVTMQVFKGTELVDWLINSALCIDRGEAVHYGNRLMLGRVIHHVGDEHFLYDLPYFYEFMNN